MMKIKQKLMMFLGPQSGRCSSVPDAPESQQTWKGWGMGCAITEPGKGVRKVPVAMLALPVGKWHRA